MALITCRECGKELSSKATSCPHCGAPAPRETGVVTYLFWGALVLGCVYWLAQPSEKPAVEAKKTAEDEAKTKRYEIARDIVETTRDMLRDPDSLKVHQMLMNSDASIICVDYSASNGFGGRNRERVVMVEENGSTRAGDWAKDCRRELIDMTWAAQ
jgi:hypothetical protein